MALKTSDSVQACAKTKEPTIRPQLEAIGVWMM